jgi:Zn-dependent protease with chaperone function
VAISQEGGVHLVFGKVFLNIIGSKNEYKAALLFALSHELGHYVYNHPLQRSVISKVKNAVLLLGAVRIPYVILAKKKKVASLIVAGGAMALAHCAAFEKYKHDETSADEFAIEYINNHLKMYPAESVRSLLKIMQDKKIDIEPYNCYSFNKMSKEALKPNGLNPDGLNPHPFLKEREDNLYEMLLQLQ